MDYGSSGGDSECSSGCESGWTLYLDNSYIRSCHSCGDEFLQGKPRFCHEHEDEEEEEEEEEDLSMVSDASSGPPQFAEEDEYGNYNHHGCSYQYHHHAPPVNPAAALPPSKTKESRRRKNVREQGASALDDTASSSMAFLQNSFQAPPENVVLDFSQGYSTNHFQGRTVYHEEQYGFYMPPSLQHPENQWYEAKKWG